MPPRKRVERERVKRTPVLPSASAVTSQMSKQIDAVVKAIRKRFGDDAVHRFGEFTESVIGTFPTGFKSLDEAIGIGGFPLAKLVQISGTESVGKTTLCKHLIAQAQAHGIICHFVDAEISPDSVERATALGVDVNTLLWSEVETIEAAFGIMHLAIEHMRNSEAPSLIFFDSVAAADMKSSFNRGFDEEPRRAEKASYLSNNLGKLVQAVKGTKIGIVFVNQMRERANAMPFQDPLYEPGGRALRHYNHLTLRMKMIGQIKQSGTTIGIKSRIQVKKSKLAPPFKSADLAIYFDGRIEELDENDE